MAPITLSPDIQSKLRENLSFLENYRQAQKMDIQRRDGLLRKLAPIGVVLAIGSLFISLNLAFTLLLFMCVGAYGWRQIPAFQFSQRYKKDILPILAKSFGPLTYSLEGIWDKNYVKSSGIVPSYSMLTSEDHFQGIHKGVEIHLSEVNLEKNAGKSKKTVFRGLFIQLSCQTGLGRIVVAKDAGFIGNILSGVFSNLQRVSLEDIVFEGQYEIYADNQVQARRLLTPAFMERLLNLSKVFGTASVALSIREKDVLILIPYDEGLVRPTGMKMSQLGVLSARYQKDYFEAPSLEKSVDFSYVESLAQQISTVLDMVDYLNLETRQ